MLKKAKDETILTVQIGKAGFKRERLNSRWLEKRNWSFPSSLPYEIQPRNKRFFPPKSVIFEVQDSETEKKEH